MKRTGRGLFPKARLPPGRLKATLTATECTRAADYEKWLQSDRTRTCNPAAASRHYAEPARLVAQIGKLRYTASKVVSSRRRPRSLAQDRASAAPYDEPPKRPGWRLRRSDFGLPWPVLRFFQFQGSETGL